MDFGDDLDAGIGSSLAARLVDVALDYERDQKNERRRLEAELDRAQAANRALERRLWDQDAELESLHEQLSKTRSDLDTMHATQHDRQDGLFQSLVSAKLQLADLQSILAQTKPVQPSEGADGMRALRALSKARELSTESNCDYIRPGLVRWGESEVACVLHGPVPAVEQLLELWETLTRSGRHSAPLSRAELFKAALHGEELRLQSILDPREESVNDKGSSLEPMLTEALRRACLGGHLPVARRLLELGASPMQRSSDTHRCISSLGWETPRSASSASREGADRARRLLPHFRWTAVHCAAVSGDEALLRKLLKACEESEKSPSSASAAHLDETDALGRTPLHLAATFGRSSAVKYLLLQGGDPDRKDDAGKTPKVTLQETQLVLTRLRVRGFESYDSTRVSPSALAAALESVQLTQSQSQSQSESGASDAGQEATEEALLKFARHWLPPGVAAVSADGVDATVRILTDANVLFWNASVRANRLYNEKDFDGAIGAYSRALEMAPGCSMPTSPRDLATLYYNRARAAYRLGQHVAAVEDCDCALSHDSGYRNALAQRAECHMALFEFDKAVQDFQGLLDSDPSDRQWARRLLDARTMRDIDHYEVLGVAKQVEDGQLKKAYRQACLRWHPDKHGASREASHRAHIVFRKITDAFEALSDPHKRMMYDMEQRLRAGSSARGLRRGSESAAGRSGPEEGFARWLARERERDDERIRAHRAMEAAHEKARSEEESQNAAARKAIRTALRPPAAPGGPSLQPTPVHVPEQEKDRGDNAAVDKENLPRRPSRGDLESSAKEAKRATPPQPQHRRGRGESPSSHQSAATSPQASSSARPPVMSAAATATGDRTARKYMASSRDRQAPERSETNEDDAEEGMEAGAEWAGPALEHAIHQMRARHRSRMQQPHSTVPAPHDEGGGSGPEAPASKPPAVRARGAMDIPGTIPSPGSRTGRVDVSHDDASRDAATPSPRGPRRRQQAADVGRGKGGGVVDDVGLGRKFSRLEFDGRELDSDLEDDALDASYLRDTSGTFEDEDDVDDDDDDAGIDAEFEADLARGSASRRAGLDAAAFLSGMYGSSVDDDGIMREVEEMYVRERARAREAAFHGGRGTSREFPVAAGSDEEE